MATSNNQNFSLNRDDFIKAAMRGINALFEGQSPNPIQISDISQAMNMLAKQWMGAADFMPGFKMWTRKRATVFLEKGKSKYTLGPNGDHATTSYTETAMKVAAVATDGTVDVDSITGMTTADFIGVVLDDGEIHFTTINGAPSGDTVTLTTAMPSAAAIGKAVYFYTTKVQRPLDILFINIQDSNGDDLPLNPMTLGEYESIGDKDASGRPTQYYFEKLRTDADLYLDYAVDEVTDSLEVTFLRPVDDFDAATDELDMPQVWFRPFKYQLMIDIAPEFHKPVTNDMYKLASDSLAIAGNTDPETTEAYFLPEAE